MLRIGYYQKLKVVKKVDFGVYLAEPEEMEERVLLPAKQVPPDTSEGDDIRVFIYRDSSDRPIATTRRPALSVGEFALLEVKQTGKIGAFLDMGLERDLLLPFKEQTYPVKAGDKVLAAMYVDKSGRLAATMKVYDYLSKNPPYSPGDEVEGLIYQIEERFGAFVAVDMKYSGLIPVKEFFGQARCSDVVHLRVTNVKEDGKLDLSLRRKAYEQIDEDAQVLLKLIRDSGGHLPLGDRSDPEEIRKVCGMSKAAFKRASGRLYKEGLAVIGPESVSIAE